MIYPNNILLVRNNKVFVFIQVCFSFIAEEIANAISSPVGSSDLYSDADLERELELLAQEEIKEDMMKITPLPDVPISSSSSVATIKTNHQSDELRQLEAWAQ